MTHKWNYGDAYLRHPIERGKAVFTDGSCLMVNNIFSPLPDFMRQADLLFVDPPWNKGNMTSFYTKADMMPPAETYEDFYARLFACIKEISPDVCYLEIGKEHLADFVVEMRKLYKKVTFYNSSYYHKRDNRCYVVRGWENVESLLVSTIWMKRISLNGCASTKHISASEICAWDEG